MKVLSTLGENSWKAKPKLFPLCAIPHESQSQSQIPRGPLQHPNQNTHYTNQGPCAPVGALGIWNQSAWNTTIIDRISGTGPCFRVKWRTAGKVWFMLFSSFLPVWGGLWGGGGETGYWAVILWSLDTFLIFPSFLSRLATREVTHICHVYK